MAAIQTTADFVIRAEWEDSASDPLIASTEKINLAWRRVRDEQRSVSREFQVNNREVFAAGRAIQSLSSVLSRALTLYNTWNLLQIRVQDANRNVRDSQKDLNEVFAEFGPDSKEFFDAMEAQKEALEEQQRVQRDTSIGYGLMVASIGAMSGQIITNVIPKLKTLNKTLGGVGGRLGSILKIGGGVVGGAMIGGGIMTSQALADKELSLEEKLLSTGEQALGGALLGATIGSVVPGVGTAIGAGVGGAAGLAAGVATNFGGDIAKMLGGQQFTTIINAPTTDEMAKELENAQRRSFSYRGS